MAILPRYKRMKRRDWKDPFSWFNWYHQNKRDPVFLYRPESGRTGMIGFTNTRADSTTCAMQRGSNGIWSTVAANVLRDAHYHYDGSSSVRTLLREGAGTNSALGACSFGDDTYWNASATWTIAEATSAISGQTAYRLTNDNGATFRARAQIIGTFVNAQTDCLSVLIENVSATITDLQIYDVSVGNVHSVRFTWATGAIATTSGTGTSGASNQGTGPNGGALYRIWITATGTAAGAGAAGNQRRNYIYATGTTQNDKAVILHHAQFEAATSYPSSPIVTVAGAVTRAADLISVAWPYAPAACTIYADLYDLSGDVGTKSLMIIGTTGAAASAQLYKFNTLWCSRATMAAGNSDSNAAAGPSFGGRVELRQVLAVSGGNVTSQLGQSINAAAEVVAAAGTARALDAAWIANAKLYIGRTDIPANLAIRSICIVLGNEQSMATMRQIARQ